METHNNHYLGMIFIFIGLILSIVISDYFLYILNVEHFVYWKEFYFDKFVYMISAVGTGITVGVIFVIYGFYLILKNE